MDSRSPAVSPRVVAEIFMTQNALLMGVSLFMNKGLFLSKDQEVEGPGFHGRPGMGIFSGGCWSLSKLRARQVDTVGLGIQGDGTGPGLGADIFDQAVFVRAVLVDDVQCAD